MYNIIIYYCTIFFLDLVMIYLLWSATSEADQPRCKIIFFACSTTPIAMLDFATIHIRIYIRIVVTLSTHILTHSNATPRIRARIWHAIIAARIYIRRKWIRAGH